MATFTQDWYESASAAAARNAGLKAADATYTPLGEDAYEFDPLAVGADVARYYETALGAQPGYENILRNISGVLAPDVKRQIAQAAAERGVGIGSYGGANDASALLRALGLTSQQLSDTGLDQFAKAYATVPELSTARLFVSPTEREQMNLQWKLQQAEIAAAAARQREALASQERLGRLSAGTAITTAGMNLSAQERWAQVNREAAEKWRSTVAGQLAALDSRLTGASTDTSTYGTKPAETIAPVPSWWYQGASTKPGTGSMFVGTMPRSDIPTADEERGLLGGTITPEELGLQPGYFNLGPDAVYGQFEQDFWSGSNIPSANDYATFESEFWGE